MEMNSGPHKPETMRETIPTHEKTTFVISVGTRWMKGIARLSAQIVGISLIAQI